MITVGDLCSRCVHRLGKIDGWKSACEAFPDGIGGFIPKEGEICNKGFKFEQDPETAEFWEKAFSYKKKINRTNE